MTCRKAFIVAICLAALIWGGNGNFGSALARDDSQKREAQTLGRKATKALGKINKYYTKGRFEEADMVAKKFLAGDDVNDQEAYTVWMWVSTIAGAAGDELSSIEAYKTALAAAEKILPEKYEIEMLFSLSQRYFRSSEFDQAMHYLRAWAPREKPVELSQLAYVAQANYMVGRYKTAAKYIKEVIDANSRADIVRPRQSWFRLLASAQWESEHQIDTINTWSMFLNAWPEVAEEACAGIAAAYKAQHGWDDGKSLAEAARHREQCGENQEVRAPSRLALSKPEPFHLWASEESSGCMPIVRVMPSYPIKAMQRSVTGSVIVRLNADENGHADPISIEVVEANPKGFFERSAIRAASKFKYNPTTPDGKSICKKGMTYRFTYDLVE